jgi:AraC-like DNA-binding protein
MPRNPDIGVIYIWPDRFLSICQLPPNLLHDFPLPVLKINLDRTLRVTSDGKHWFECRSVFWPEEATHQSVYGDSLIAIMIFQPGTIDSTFAADNMAKDQGFLHSFKHEETAIRIFREIYEQRPDAKTAYKMQMRALGIENPLEPHSGQQHLDRRITKAIRIINTQPPPPDTSIEYMANQVNLSRHYFIRLFKKETGVSFSRYRIFTRLLQSCILMSKGHNLTHAALETGFTDVAHLSNAYRKIFGMKASETMKVSAGVEYIIDKRLLAESGSTK